MASLLAVGSLALSVNAKDLREEVVTATAEYFAPSTMPPYQARQEGITRAQVDAIADAFGCSLSQSNISFMQDSEEGLRDDFYSIAESDVKGEWLETIGDTTINVRHLRDETVYSVKLKGRIREIAGNRIDIDSRLLFNGTDKDRNRLRGFTYKVGDFMYLYFNSPVDGYLAVYLGDDDGDMSLQRLLPMEGTGEGAYPVKADREYIFFSKEDAEPEYRQFTRRLKMNARKDIDINQLYVIFSPNPFSKTADAKRDEQRDATLEGDPLSLLPPSVSYKAFSKWLSRCRRKDPDMQILKSVVTIEK